MKVKQEITTIDLVLGVYLSLENMTVKFIQSKQGEKPVLGMKITNEDPAKDLDTSIKHYKEKIRPYLKKGRRGKVAVEGGQQQFEVSLLRSFFEA